MNAVVIIPAYKPDQSLLDLAESLIEKQFSLIIINDGSGEPYATIFEQLKNKNNVHLIEHAVNLGKGQALKTGFNYFLNHFPQGVGVVTADADGQHLIQDIAQVAGTLTQHPNTLCLGARTFKNKVPLRSQFGNIVTRHVFKLLLGRALTDTQTGLRGIPAEFLKPLLRMPTNGYDFELDMLVVASKQKMNILEVPIKTVYINENKSSHFNPIKDSFKIYFVFVRFLFFSLISGLLDFLAFSIGFMLTQQIFLSETLARIFSGSCNFLFNKELVFKSKQRPVPEAIKYAILCGVNLVFSYAFIQSLIYIGVNVFLSKLIALFGLFLANFAIQKVLVFGSKEDAVSVVKST